MTAMMPCQFGREPHQPDESGVRCLSCGLVIASTLSLCTSGAHLGGQSGRWCLVCGDELPPSPKPTKVRTRGCPATVANYSDAHGGPHACDHHQSPHGGLHHCPCGVNWVGALSAPEVRPLTSGEQSRVAKKANGMPKGKHVKRHHLSGAQMPGERGMKRRYALAARDGYGCHYCGRWDGRGDLSLLTLDHVLPDSRGGSSALANLVLACVKCNSEKGDRTPKEWTDRWYYTDEEIAAARAKVARGQ